MFTYLLAGENLELAEHELRGFLESQELSNEVERHGRLVIAEAPIPGQLKRLALTHEIAEIIERGKIDELEPEYQPKNSFAVRAIGAADKEYDTAAIQQHVGEILSTEDNEVELERPEEELRLYLLEDQYVLSRLVLDIDRGLFEKRKNQERSFSSPVSLDPVLARVLVNLSGVKPQEHVLDPFCGTGGILIEAGLCGIGVHGLDVQEQMVEGTQKNLEEYGIINHDIRQGEVKHAPEIFNRKFDAVVTDLPYGEASKVEGSPVQDFLEAAPELTDGPVVFMSNQDRINDLEPEHQIYVHKNLTRYVYIIQ